MQAVTREPPAESMAESPWEQLGVLDCEGRFLYCFAGARALSSASSELVGSAFDELLAPDDRDRLRVALTDLGQHRACLRLDLASTCELAASATTLDCRLTGMRGRDGERAVLLEARSARAAGRDSGGRGEEQWTHPAQAALLQKQAKLEAILRALPDLFFRFDAEGRFLDISSAPDLPPYAPPELLLGKRPIEVLPAPLAAEMERARLETHATGALVTLEYELEIEGKTQHFEARYVPHLEGQTIALVRNVSERVQAERALRVSEARLRESQKLDAVGRLAGGVAHDFNNLLMIILGYTAAIGRHIPAKHPAAASLDEIGRAVDRATALTRQLLALSRRQPVQRTILDVGIVLNDMGRMLARVIGEHIAFSLEVGPGLARLHADRSQIEQIVLNLALNARDAMPRGGELHIRAENVPAEGMQGGRFVRLTVADTGEGMAAETRARIFEPFFTTKARGTGLGLFTVQHIVGEYGGTIDVESERGGGTRIVVRLPGVEQAADVAVEEQPLPPIGGKETVLVVEDEESVRTLLVGVLRQLGYAVLAAESAHEAMQHLAAHDRAVDVLLTDVVMPGGTGWELAGKVVAARPDCRVLYMSGHALGSDDTPRALAIEGELLHKPFTPAALAARLRELLTSRAPRTLAS